MEPRQSEGAESLASFESLPRDMVKNTLRILDYEDVIHKLDPDHWDVISLRTPSRRVRVYRRGDLIRCRVDKKNNQDQPCSHILAVMVHEGMGELPNTAAVVYQKTGVDRNHSLEERAWRAVPAKVPELLARLRREGLPVIAPEGPDTGGRPRTPLYSLVYQAVLRVAERRRLRALHGARGSAVA